MLVKETHQARVLYDALEMEEPSVDLLLLQQKLNVDFYNDLAQATRWLEE